MNTYHIFGIMGGEKKKVRAINAEEAIRIAYGNDPWNVPFGITVKTSAQVKKARSRRKKGLSF